MSAPFAATFSGPDLIALTRALIDKAPYARGVPRSMDVKMNDKPVAADWRDQLLAPKVDGLSVKWGNGERIARNPWAISAGFPELRLEPKAILDALAPLPFEIAVIPPTAENWVRDGYFPPAIGPDHALLGWGMVIKGHGHDRSIVSRRWLEHGPFRVHRGPEDTTFLEFHELTATGPTSIEQAGPAHEWVIAGFLRGKQRYKNDVKGVYTKDDGLLRLVINDREISDAELLDACAARRDGRDDKDKPIKNIAYAFVDEAEAKQNLERLWLRGLECRLATPSGERRLDDGYQPAVKKPSWTKGS